MRTKTLDELFWDYHRENPDVFRLFRMFATNAWLKGHKHYSAKTIFERIRWHYSVDTDRLDGFKLNNNYTSRYSLYLEMLDADFVGFFRHRGDITLTIPQDILTGQEVLF